MGILSFLRRKKPPTAEERRQWLLKHGRITDGVILINEIAENGDHIARYTYHVHGVEFESSDVLTVEQQQDELSYAEGASVAIRFDPRNHGNAVLV